MGASLAGLFTFFGGRASAREKAGRPTDATLADLTARLDLAESKQAIADVLHRYAQGDDRADEALKRTCFWPDATVKYGSFDGTATDFVTFAMKIVRPLRYCAHHVSNVWVEIKGDRAVSECHYFAHHRRVASSGTGEEDAFFEGRYVDRLERRDGTWKIAHRRGLRDYTIVIPAGSSVEIPVEQRSARVPDDPLYTMLTELRAGH
jgi:SnoaL-like domain